MISLLGLPEREEDGSWSLVIECPECFAAVRVFDGYGRDPSGGVTEFECVCGHSGVCAVVVLGGWCAPVKGVSDE